VFVKEFNNLKWRKPAKWQGNKSFLNNGSLNELKEILEVLERFASLFLKKVNLIIV
jgi:hypothetical protein